MDELLFYVTTEHAGDRVDKYLADRLTYLSRARLQTYLKEGFAQVNGKLAKPAYRLENGDTISLDIPDEPFSDAVEPQDIPLDILYEDEYLLAINKPAGMVVHPAINHETGTLVNALLARYPHLRKWHPPERAGIIHRLDKLTSGVILVALSEETHLYMAAKFQQREIIKVYWALVDGYPPSNVGTIEASIGRHPGFRQKMTTLKGGKDASTDFKVLEKYPHHTLLELYPETGRTHQIRVHLAFIGCPVAGDVLYGKKKSTIPLSRFFLHARSITFTHPMTGEGLLIEAPLAPELEVLLEELTPKKPLAGSDSPEDGQYLPQEQRQEE